MKIKRMMCLLLCALLMVGCIPFTAAADADAEAVPSPEADETLPAPDEAEPVEEIPADDAEPAEEIPADDAEPAEEIPADDAEPAEEVPADDAEPADELPADEAEAADEPAPLAELPPSELQNFWKLLQDKDDPDIKIAYLGGSVTVGSGASNLEKTSWRALVGQWFTDTFGPGTSYNKNVTNVHAAIGATGSYFGSYRVYQDAQLGSDNPPDILFIEFAINDIYDALTDKQVYVNYESVIRQAYKANPKINVIPVFTQDSTIANNLIMTGQENSRFFSAQREIAEFYHLPQVNVGKALVEVMKAENNNQPLTNPSPVYNKYMTDASHPTDAGYKIYADCAIEYLTKQLLSDEVSHDGEVTTVELASTPSLCEEKGYGKDIKENGRYISFKDAGFTQKNFNGWSLSTKNTASTLADSNGTITTNRAGASFAFRFKGTAVGFFNYGYIESGMLSFTVTSVSNPEKVFTGKTNLVKTYSGGLPFPGELITGLDDEEWKVECVLTAGANGTRGDLRYIYIDGDLSSIQPLDAPETELADVPPAVVTAASLPTAYAAKLGTTGTYEGLTARGVTVNPGDTANNIPQVDNYNVRLSLRDYKVFSVTYYLDTAGKPTDPVKTIAMQYDQLVKADGSGFAGWLPGTPNFPYSIARKSAPIQSGKWVTQYLDFTEFAEKAEELYPGQILGQGRLYPFGTESEITKNSVPGDFTLYINSWRFYSKMPKLYNADNTLSDYNDGTQHVYVSPTGSVTVDGKQYPAYSDFPSAIDALSPVGGTVYFTGEMNFSDGTVTERGKITIEGLDDSAKLLNLNLIIANGDVELKNLTFQGDNDEYWSSTRGHLLTLGEGFKVAVKMAPAAGVNSNGKPNRLDIYNGSFRDFGAIGGYGQTLTITGDSIYNIYGGSLSTIAGFARNGKQDGGMHTLNGDAIFNFYGGTYGGSLATATTTGTLNGSLWYNVYGGTFGGNAKFLFGSLQSKSATVKGGHVVEIYSKEIKEAGGSLGGIAIGTIYNNGVDGKTFVIINNSELASEIGAAISSGAKGDYQLMVENGKAVPVFDETTFALKGFEITSDVEGLEPSIGGQVLLQNEYDLYQIDAENGVTRTIQFIESTEDMVEVRFTDGTHNIDRLNRRNSPVLIPTATAEMTQEGKVFAGWKLEDVDYYPGETYMVGEDAVTFEAQFVERAAIDKVYVKASATANGVGVAKRSPVTTIDQAITIGGTDRDYTIVFLDEYTILGYVPFKQHTGVLTLSTEDEGVLSWREQLMPNGPWIIKDAKIRVLQDNQFVNTYGYDCAFGENVEPLAYNGSTNLPRFHIGNDNSDSRYFKFIVNGSRLATLHLGTYYVTTGEHRNTDGGKVTVNDGTIGRIIFGPDNFSGHQGTVTSTNSMSVVINGGTVSSVSSNGLITLSNGAKYQIVLNNGAALPPISAILDDDRTIVRSGEGGHIDATETTGVFEIITDKAKIFIDGVETPKAEDNLYTIGAGDHTVTYGDGACVSVGGKDLPVDADFTLTIDEENEGTVDFTANPAPEKDGSLFLGWYYDGRDEAVEDGAELASGTKITAKFVDFVTDTNGGEALEACDFAVIGAQIRLSGSPAFRFLNRMNLSVRDAVAALNETLVPQSPDDKGVGYGFVMLPEELLGGEELTKETARAAIVPAVLNYGEDETSITYTVCLTDVLPANYGRNYTVRAYITYLDAQEIEHTVYGESYATSMTAVAKAALADGSGLSEQDRAALQKIAGE